MTDLSGLSQEFHADGSVIEQLDLHVGSKTSRPHTVHPQALTKLRHNQFIKWMGLFRASRV